jgi:hypothetical protein
MPIVRTGKQRWRAQCAVCKWRSQITSSKTGAAWRLTEHMDRIHMAPLWRAGAGGWGRPNGGGARA